MSKTTWLVEDRLRDELHTFPSRVAALSYITNASKELLEAAKAQNPTKRIWLEQERNEYTREDKFILIIEDSNRSTWYWLREREQR